MQQKIIRPSRFPFLAQPYPLARMALWLIIVLVAYASLTPFNFYLAAPNLAYEWVRAPLPRYIPLFDVTTNILGYLPFGFLMVFTIEYNLILLHASKLARGGRSSCSVGPGRDRILRSPAYISADLY